MNASSLMVRLNAGTSNEAVLRAAVDLVERLHVTRAIGVSACQPLQIIGSPDAYIPRELATGDMERNQKELSAAEWAFRSALEGHVKTCQWRSTTINYGTIADYITEQMRAADFLITAADRGSIYDRNHFDLDDLIMKAGRPVLVVGSSVDQLDLRNVLIGWKETREARRATQDALPLLKLAGRVMVVEVAAKQDLQQARERTEDVAAWLANHGISGVACGVPTTGDDAADIGNIAKELDAGLVVGGAYGHSRLREWVMGGVTRDLLMRPINCSFNLTDFVGRAVPSPGARSRYRYCSRELEEASMTTSDLMSIPENRASKIGIMRTGLVSGLVLGAIHLFWSILVAAGVAQAVMDFLFRLHFIRPVFVIEVFSLVQAIGLVLLTATSGYCIGALFAALWNRLHR